MQSMALYDVSRKTCFDIIPYGNNLFVRRSQGTWLYLCTQFVTVSQEKQLW